MSNPIEQAASRLQPLLLDHLRAHPQGLSEHELIKRLREQGVEGFDAASMRSALGLFRAHFLLFHCLYRLRSVLLSKGETLNINCLRINLVRGSGGEGLPAEPDPLAGFYLDASNLERMDTSDVVRMLGDFWRRFRRQDVRTDALAELGLEPSAGADEIKRRYRKLAMQHHPDRGGDTAKLQRLNAAMAVLED